MRGVPGTLFIVGTPIGNLEDISLRAARVLREADLVAAEDTRAAGVLLAHVDALGPSNPGRRVVSNFEGNEAGRADDIGRALRAGARVAVISEAGMPGVSDPGGHAIARSEEHTSELQSRLHLLCRLLLEKKKKTKKYLTDLESCRASAALSGCTTVS